MDEVSLEDFLLKYDFRITNDKDIQLTRIIRICLDTVGENDWIYFGLYYFDSEENIYYLLKDFLHLNYVLNFGFHKYFYFFLKY